MKTHLITLLVATLTLAACGADGPPTRPTKTEPASQGAITVSGEGRFGVTASN